MATESNQSTRVGDAQFKVKTVNFTDGDRKAPIMRGGKGSGSADTPSGGKTNSGMLAHGWNEEKIANQKRG